MSTLPVDIDLNFIHVSSGSIHNAEFELYNNTSNEFKCCFYVPCDKHICQLAYNIWEKTGRDDATANWLEAESILWKRSYADQFLNGAPFLFPNKPEN